LTLICQESASSIPYLIQLNSFWKFKAFVQNALRYTNNKTLIDTATYEWLTLESFSLLFHCNIIFILSIELIARVDESFAMFHFRRYR
jgi:hypothetical protein